MSKQVIDKFQGISSYEVKPFNRFTVDKVFSPALSFVVSLFVLFSISPPFLFHKPFVFSIPRLSVTRLLFVSILNAIFACAVEQCLKKCIT